MANKSAKVVNWWLGLHFKMRHCGLLFHSSRGLCSLLMYPLARLILNTLISWIFHFSWRHSIFVNGELALSGRSWFPVFEVLLIDISVSIIMLLHGAAFGSLLTGMYVAAVLLPLALITVFAHPKGLIGFARRVVIWMSELTKVRISAPSAISTGAITRAWDIQMLLLNCWRPVRTSLLSVLPRQTSSMASTWILHWELLSSLIVMYWALILPWISLLLIEFAFASKVKAVVVLDLTWARNTMRPRASRKVQMQIMVHIQHGIIRANQTTCWLLLMIQVQSLRRHGTVSHHLFSGTPPRLKLFPSLLPAFPFLFFVFLKQSLLLFLFSFRFLFCLIFQLQFTLEELGAA